jgi:hypothetical protein
MNRLKTFLLCLCMILSVFPAAGSSDDSNQNSTISDETLTQEEPVSDVPKEKTIISEPETPDIVEQEKQGNKKID